MSLSSWMGAASASTIPKANCCTLDTGAAYVDSRPTFLAQCSFLGNSLTLLDTREWSVLQFANVSVDALQVHTPDINKVKLVPVVRMEMSPGDLVQLFALEES